MKNIDIDTIDFFERIIEHTRKVEFNVCAHVLEHYIGKELFYATALKVLPNETLSDINKRTIYEIAPAVLMVDFEVYGINGRDLVPLINNDILTGKLQLQRTLDDASFGIYENQCNEPLFAEDLSYLITYLPEYIDVDECTRSKILELAVFESRNEPERRIDINMERLSLYVNSDSYEHYRYKLNMKKLKRSDAHLASIIQDIITYNGDNNEILEEMKSYTLSNTPIQKFVSNYTTMVFIENKEFNRLKLTNQKWVSELNDARIYRDTVDGYVRITALNVSLEDENISDLFDNLCGEN